MKRNLKRAISVVLLLCMLISFAVPTANAGIFDWIGGTSSSGNTSTPIIYNFDQAAKSIYNKVTDVAVALQGGDELKAQVTNTQGKCTLGIMERYSLSSTEEWAINWTYETASAGMRRTNTAENHLPNTDVRFWRDCGLRSVMDQDQWIAFRIKSPGAGTYAIDLNYYGYTGSGTVAFYILEANGQASLNKTDVLTRAETIENAIDPDNRLALVELYSGTAGTINTAFLGNWNFKANKEYIVVMECYEPAPCPDNRYVYLTNLTMTAGEKTADEKPANDRIRQQLVKENVITVADAGSMAAVWEIDGQDYYYLPIEGGQLLIFNLDTWELAKRVETDIGYPTSTAVVEWIDENGNVQTELFIGGNGRRMFGYNLNTGKTRMTPFFHQTTGLEKENDIRGITSYNGKVYVGLSYDGHLAEYDPATNQYTNLGDMIMEEFSPELGEEGEVTGEDNGGIQAISCYGDYLYLTATSLVSQKIIKYDLVNKTTVTEVDISEKFDVNTGARGLTILGDGDYLIAGGSSFLSLALIDLATMELLNQEESIALGLDNAAWNGGMYQSATNVIETKDASGNNLYKQYFVAGGIVYAYNIQSQKFEKIGGPFNGFNTAGKQSVTLSLNGSEEKLYLFGYAAGGQVRLCEPTVGKKISPENIMKPEYGTNGADMRINTVGEGSDSTTLYLGAFNTPGAAAFDSVTGTFTNYRTEGQTDSQIWYNGKLYAGNYSACVVYEIDMADPDNNKAVISKMITYDQKRIHTLAAGDGYIFAGTLPTTYLNAGGIGMYNTITGQESFIRFGETPVNGEMVVPESFSQLWNQSVKGLIYRNELLYGCTTRSGGSASTYAEGTSAQIFVYDYKNNQFLSTLDLREYIPEYLPSATDPIDFITGITADPVIEDRFWGIVSDVLFTFTFDRSTSQWNVNVVHDRKHTEYKTTSNRAWFNVPVVFDPDNNNVYVSFISEGIYRITLNDWNTATEESSQRILGVAPTYYAMGADNMLYYASGANLRALPVNVTTEDWSIAQSWDTLVNAIGDVTLDDAQAIQTARAAYADLTLRDKCLVQELAALEEAEAELLELLIEAEAKALSSESVEVLESYIAQYDSMTDRQQRYVKNYAVLTQSYETSVALREAETEYAIKVQTQINALHVTTVDDAQAVTDARTAYEKLNDRQKALVDITNLAVAEARLATLVSAANVQSQIDELPDNITLADEATVTAIRTIYDALSDDVKAEVTTTKLVFAETQITELKAAQIIQEQINSLPKKITLENQAAIVAIRDAYDALSEKAKAEVDTIKLVSAEAQLAKLLLDKAELQVYDFKLYDNETYMQHIKDMIVEKGAPEDVVLVNHNLYKYSLTSAIYYTGPYKWFDSAFPSTINWAPEGTDGEAPSDIGKDYIVDPASKSGLKLQFGKPADGKYGWVGFRIRVAAAGQYQINLSLFNTYINANDFGAGDVLDIYIFEAFEGYVLNKDNTAQIAPYLVENNLAGSITCNAATDGSTTTSYMVNQAFNFEVAGDYVLVIKERTTSTCRYVYLDTLSLINNVAKEDAVAEVGGRYFRTLDKALEYQAMCGAKSVSLLNNAEIMDLILQSGVTLDLNGYTITADSVLTFSSSAIIDSSEKDTGVLIINNADGNMLSENNPQLPIYNKTAGGYRFFELSVKSVAVTGGSKFWFKVNVENFAEFYKLIQNGSELNIEAKLIWNGGEANAIADPQFVVKWAEKYAAGDNFYITVSAINTDGLENFSLTPCITANSVIIYGDEMCIA